MSNFEFSKYCTPAQLYLVLGAIGIIVSFFKNYSVETNLMNALFLVIWTWVLNWLCSKGFSAISWILVLLPFIMVLFTYFFVKDVAKEAFEDEGFFEGAINNKKPLTDQQKKDRDTATKLAYEKEREKRRQARQGFEGFDEGYAMGRGRVRIPRAMGRIEGFEDEGFEDEGFFEGIKKNSQNKYRNRR
jgi:hypothetical protein